MQHQVHRPGVKRFEELGRRVVIKTSSWMSESESSTSSTTSSVVSFFSLVIGLPLLGFGSLSFSCFEAGARAWQLLGSCSSAPQQPSHTPPLAIHANTTPQTPSKKPFDVYFRILHAYTIIYFNIGFFACGQATPSCGSESQQQCRLSWSVTYQQFVGPASVVMKSGQKGSWDL